MTAHRLIRAALASICPLVAAASLSTQVALAEPCPNAAMRTGASAQLPDCRAYELVTPADKLEASQDLSFGGSGFAQVALPSLDGNRLALMAAGVPFGPNPVAGGSTFAVFSRTSSDWELIPVNPPNSSGDRYTGYPGNVLFNASLTQAAVSRETLPLPALTESFGAGSVGGPYANLATVPAESVEGESSYLAAATPDFSSIFLDSTVQTLAGGAQGPTVAGAHAVYRWSEGRFVREDLTSAGAPVSSCGAELHWISNDGVKVFFLSPDPNAIYPASHEPACEQPSQLYMRVHGETIDVSAPDPGVVDPAGPRPVEFAGASSDGSKIFFATTAELTPDDAGLHDDEIYEYDTATRALTRISHGESGTAAGETEGASETSRFAVSQDGSTVYFGSRAQLTANAPVPPAGVLGYRNIYRYDTDDGTTHYVATAEPSNDPSTPILRTFETGMGDLTATTPSGRFLLFDSDGVVGNYNSGNIKQVYRYDANDESVTCISCPSSGTPVQGEAELPSTTRLSSINRVPRFVAITDDGSYVFFMSTDQLVPQDTNVLGGEPNFGSPTGTDVYEWHDGIVSLISSGNDTHEATLLGASADGSDVFFSTHSQLVPEDTDASGDVYDARIDGGFPPPPQAAPCEGDACHSPASAPNDPTPASSVFAGPGNVSLQASIAPKAKPKRSSKRRRCPRGKVRRKRRCVKVARAKTVIKHNNRGGSK